MSRRLVVGLVTWAASLVMFAVGSAGGAVAAGCRSVAGSDACLGLKAKPYVSPAQAERVVAALWRAREKARVSRDVDPLSSIETGSAKLTDVAAIQDLGCGCGDFYWTRGQRRFRNAVVYVVRQSSYPLFFAADVSEEVPGLPSPASDAHAFLILTRASPSEPWRIAVQLFDTGYEASAGFPAPSLDSSGYDAPASSPSPNVTRGWFPRYIAYMNEIKRTGHQPSSTPFAPGPLTSGNGMQVRPDGNTTNGLAATYTFKPGPYGGPWTFTSGGATMVCGDVSEDAAAAPAQAGHVLIQPPNRHNWGWDIAPGYYRKITTRWEWPICIYSSGGSLSVGGDLQGAYPIQSSGIKSESGTPGTGTPQV